MLLVQDNAMTDAQIQQAATAEWLGVLRELWEAIGKPVDEKRLTIYARQLEIVPLGLLEKAAARAIRNNGQYQTVPTPGAIWNAVQKELGDSNPTMDIADVIENWCETNFCRCVVRFE